MTELTWLINYLVYVLFVAIFKKNTNKKTRSRCGSLRRSKKYRYARIFLSVYKKIVIFFCRYFFFCFRPRARSFYSQLKKAAEPGKNFHNARSLQENLARSAAYPKRAYYCT